MASLVVNKNYVRELCPNLSSADAAIDLIISAVSCKLDSCLTTSYADCIDVAQAIKVYTICHLLTVSSRVGQIKSRGYANGASESFDSYVNGGQGLNATEFGESILMLDTAGCVNAAFPPTSRLFITTAGTTGSQDRGFFRGDELI